MVRPVKTMPIQATHDMIEAAYTLLETMPRGSPERHKRIVAKTWETMAEFAPAERAHGLTRLQQQVHELIAEYIQENGISPTYREIGAMMGKGKSDVHQIVHALKRRGAITFREGRRRSIVLIAKPGEKLIRPPKKEVAK